MKKVKKTKREYYQVVTTDKEHFFMEHKTIVPAIEQITYLLNGTAPENTYKYEILHVVETRKEETIKYPVYLWNGNPRLPSGGD